MKTLQLTIGIVICIASARIVFAQSPEGLIDYEVKINMHRNLPPDRQEMKNMMPEFRTIRHQLFFTTKESLYKPVEEEEEDPFESNHGGMRMRFQQPQVEVYFNPSEQKRITQEDFMGKQYLIEDTLQMTPWKFGTETKTVVGIECKQATYVDEVRKQSIVAWYAPSLRPFLGPEIYHTLPGGVLEVNINDGERVIVATKVSPRPLKKNELKIPTQGIKTSRHEFNKLREAQMEKMRANGANVIIRN